jgi:HlyD family secretion protein
VARRNDVLRVPNAALRFKPDGIEAPAQAGGGGGWADDLARAAQPLALRAEQQAALDAVLATMRERARQRAAATAAAPAGNTGAGASPGGAPMGGAAGAGGGDFRARMQQMLRSSLAPFRDSLDPAQRTAWDTAFDQVLAARRVTVWVLEQGKPAPRSVRAGVSDATHTEVLGDGLAAGAAVIVGAAAS